MESAVKLENDDLERRLETTRLGLTEATQSIRELQMENQQLKERIAHNLDNDRHLQVGPHERNIEAVLQNHNPYVIVLIDGNGLLV
jgi:hypothetical protein